MQLLIPAWDTCFLCLRQGKVSASHRILWDAITYPCLRYLLLVLLFVPQAGKSNCIPQNTVGCNYLSLPEVPASGAKVLIYVCMATMTVYQKGVLILVGEPPHSIPPRGTQIACLDNSFTVTGFPEMCGPRQFIQWIPVIVCFLACQGSLLLTWINFKPSMNKWSHAQ